MYKIVSTKRFARMYDKMIYGDKELEEKVSKALHLMKINPFYSSLKTHKVSLSIYGEKLSSWITGDIRIIWDFDDDKLTIWLFDIGRHSGKNKVYK